MHLLSKLYIVGACCSKYDFVYYLQKYVCVHTQMQLCSMELVTGLFICLRSAAKITHKAQAITCHAARWHVCATIDAFDGIESEIPSPSLVPSSQDHGDSSLEDSGDDESSSSDIADTKFVPLNAAITISFQKRQALGKLPTKLMHAPRSDCDRIP